MRARRQNHHDALPEADAYLLAPTFIASSGDFGSFATGTLIAIAQVVIRIDADLLIGGESKGIVMLLICI